MTDLIERLQAARRKTVAVSATVRAVGANKTTLDRMANTCADAAAEIERQAARIAELEAENARLREAFRIAEIDAETIRIVLIDRLEEPDRTAFWTAVRVRDTARAALNPGDQK